MTMSQADELRTSLESRTTDELVAILRNRNEDEWRSEVFDLVASILSGRVVSPATVSAMGPEGSDVIEERPLATVARYFSPAEAHTGRMALEGAGIQAWVIDEALGTAYGVGVGTRLQVRVEDEESARTVLTDGPASPSTLPAELAEPPCPRCGSPDVRQSSELIRDSDVAQVRGGHRRRWHYNCSACGHRWAADDD
jgi:hypothetical protein